MRIAPTTTMLAGEVEANQRIVDANGQRWIIDYVVKRADKVEVFCFPAGREASKRRGLSYKPNETVTVELAPEIGKGILDALVDALAQSPVCMTKSGDSTKPAAEPDITIEGAGDGYIITGTKPHVWQLELEP